MEEEILIYETPCLDEIDFGGYQVRGDETGMSKEITDNIDTEEDVD